MNPTTIGYLTHTWNPIVMRCDRVSEACKNCWHLAMAHRKAHNPLVPAEERRAYAGEVGPILIDRRLKEPGKRRKSATIGVQFMGDLFHEKISLDCILRIWRSMQLAKQHTFLVLTKRPERMKLFLLEWMPGAWEFAFFERPFGPFSNIWLGVTAENQKQADARIPLLLQTPAAVRFVSVEPMLGPVNLTIKYHAGAGAIHNMNALRGYGGWRDYDRDKYKLHWIICGGETGPGARPMNPDWARSVRDQCQSAGVPYFFKQMTKKMSIPDDLMIREFPK